jgi:hypothetical protein
MRTQSRWTHEPLPGGRHGLSRDAAMARAYFVELPAAGPRAIAERDRQYERFVALNRIIANHSRGPDDPGPSGLELELGG